MEKRKSHSSDENAYLLDSNNAKRLRLESRPESNKDDSYWIVQWRNYQAKKNKTWEGDGVLVVLSGSRATLYDSTDGKQIGSGKSQMPLFDGKVFSIGGKDVELDREITKQEYLSGTCFGSNSVLIDHPMQDLPRQTLAKVFKPPTMRIPGRETASTNVLLESSTSSHLLQVPCLPTPVYETGANSRAEPNDSTSTGPSVWAVNWRKTQPSSKKQISWEGDAFLSCKDQKMSMLSEEGELIGTSTCKNHQHKSGDHCFVGMRELLLLHKVTSAALSLPPSSNLTSLGNEPKHSLLASSSPIPPPPNRYIPPTSFYAVPPRPKKPVGPLHDPDAENAIVMKAPTKEHLERYNKRDRPVVPVVVDPILARRLRPHQEEGVKFMYECVMGLRKHEGQGCILADEMGLGKTLQTITLIWTLIRQNPCAGAGPIASKVLIVCPVSLINNWKAEFYKWLGRDRLSVSVCDRDTNTAKTFATSQKQQVLIVGYERLRSIMIGLVICDEGHRLKSSKAKTSAIFKQLTTLRRIILSGTPIQNDLGEFHSMVEFCNPGLLDEYSAFRRLYEAPILKSRAPGCTSKELELGEKRSAQLSNIAKSFVLRREATILGDYLPPKHEYVVFVTPTALQLSMFAKVLDPNKVDDFVESNSTAESLALINILTKISSSPILLKATADKDHQNNAEGLRRNNIREAVKLLPSNSQIEDLTLSGKMIALSNLLASIKQESEEKCVLVSHYTSTLNILESFCKNRNYSYFRLDGQTPAAKRQEYVTTFNKTNQRTSFVFLLSSKAGGTGINLIGASRLCLIDSDWNPSHDLQAMARCHRDGQKRPVFIYRFLTAGTIDEKIYQRQIIKLGLSNALMGSDNSKAKSKADSFTRKDLRDIFRVHPDTSSNTHDLLECVCEIKDGPEDDILADEANGSEPEYPKGFITASQVNPQREIHRIDTEYLESKRASLASLGEWEHINCLKQDAGKDVKDDLLRRILYVRPKKELTSHTGTMTEQILTAANLGNLDKIELLTARTVPGGTVSFLFERSSISTDEVESEEQIEGKDVDSIPT
ncbi:RAD54B protein [Lentinula aciculospora]|uniref:RAD54B protein n=1 Tax=Lentinula aciculospora TaxID=153920 RepID=A0A9W8ZWW2_9AGAR|nr:RAD54B protein [Lentinula aciculospora]